MSASRFNQGQVIGSYRLIRFLGRGNYGEVWLAELTEGYITKRVALKLPFDLDEEVVRQEAQVWVRASGHPNVLPVLAAGKDTSGQVFIVSEYADGGTLTSWITQSVLSCVDTPA